MKVKKLSKKEKRFQLSKDDGAYCELSTIDPLAVQSEFGENLRLNPVGPAFVTGASSSPSKRLSGSVVTAHNSPDPLAQPVKPEQKPDFLGSYYVLEVGNFNDDSPQLSPHRASHARASAAMDRGEEGEEGRGGGGGGEEGRGDGGGGEEGRGDEGVCEGVPAAYYLLDMDHMDNEDTAREDDLREARNSRSRFSSYENIGSTSPVPLAKGAMYENVMPKPVPSVPQYENIAVRRSHERQKSSPLGIPKPTIRALDGVRVGVGSHDDTTAAQRLSSSLPSPSMEPARERLVATEIADERSKDRSLSENTETTQENPSLRRHQKNSREKVYETTTIPFPKRRTEKVKKSPLREIEISESQVVLVPYDEAGGRERGGGRVMVDRERGRERGEEMVDEGRWREGGEGRERRGERVLVNGDMEREDGEKRERGKGGRMEGVSGGVSIAEMVSTSVPTTVERLESKMDDTDNLAAVRKVQADSDEREDEHTTSDVVAVAEMTEGAGEPVSVAESEGMPVNSIRSEKDVVAALDTGGEGGRRAVVHRGNEREGSEVVDAVGEKTMTEPSEKDGALVHRGDEEPTTKLIESNGLPFAGLVMSASATDSDEDMTPVTRGRVETIWDDERVRSEWSQVR